MRIQTTIGGLVILGVWLLAAIPAHAQMGTSQGGGPMTPLPSMYNPPSPMPIGGSSSSGQMWPWYGGQGAYGYATPQSYGAAGPKPFGTASGAPNYQQLDQPRPFSSAASMNSMGNVLSSSQTPTPTPATPSAPGLRPLPSARDLIRKFGWG